MSNLVRMTKVDRVGNKYQLSEVYVNPENVSYVMENLLMRRNLTEQKELWPSGLDEGHRFSTVHMSSHHTVFHVVGDPAIVQEQIFSAKKMLLKG